MKPFSLLALAALLLGACNHDRSPGGDPAPEAPKGIVRPIGTSLGAAATKDIGPQGGNLSSGDGKLKITVPAGAVTANTSFSVEPVTNTLPGSPGISYRLKPEGVKFSKPLTLQFTYNDSDLDSTDAEALFMAYQQADGIWRMMTRTALDKTNRTLTVQTDHFSTWAPYAMYWLTSMYDQVQPGKSTGVAIRTTDNYLAVNFDKSEVEIAKEKVLDDPKNIKNWKLTGAGNLASDAARPAATYTAPGAIPQQNPVTVSVEVHNFIPAGVIPGRGATGKLILQKRIRIVEDTWHYGTIAGQEFNTTQRWFFSDPYALNIQGIISATSSILLTVKIDEPVEGYFNWNIAQPANSAQAVYLPGGPGGWEGGYPHCRSGQDINSPGQLAITKVETVGGVKYVQGEYTVTVYNVAVVCDPPSKIIHGYFRLRAR